MRLGRFHVVFGDQSTVRILINQNVKMTPGKMAAQAVHAALMAYGVHHGRVVVLMGRPNQVKAMDVLVHDAGTTEIEPGTLTAGATVGDK